MGAKIPYELENPIDALIYGTADFTVTFLHKMGLKPNDITTLSFISGIISIYFLYIKKFPEAALIYFISYYFDCLDGYMARKYKQISVFGDYYDHITDVLVNGLFIYTFFTHSNAPIFLKMINIAFLLLFLINQGCVDCYIKNNGMTSITKYLCGFPNINKKQIEYNLNQTKDFGCGTYIVICCLCMLAMEYYQ